MRTFAGAWFVKYAVAVLPSLIQGKLLKKPSLLVRNAGWDTTRFALFLATFVSGFKGIQCALRRYRNVNDEWNGKTCNAAHRLT